MREAAQWPSKKAPRGPRSVDGSSDLLPAPSATRCCCICFSSVG